MVQFYDAASRLIDRTTSSSTQSFTYDANGKMIWLVADGKESAYTWNKENMLVNVVHKGSPATDAEFTYNAFNQKVLESVSSAPEDLVLVWVSGTMLGVIDIRNDYLVDAPGLFMTR